MSAKHEVELWLIGSPHYELCLSSTEVQRLYEVGEDLFVQEYFGVTPEVYAAWQARITHEAQCTATTRTGKRCNGYMAQFIGSPKGFTIGRDDRCQIHGGDRGR